MHSYSSSNVFALFLYYTVFQDKGIDIWTRPVEPVHHGNYSYAVAFVSRREDGAPYPYKITLEDLGLNHRIGYTIKVIPLMNYSVFWVLETLLYLYNRAV